MSDETIITAKEIEVVEKIEEANEEAVANVQKDINTNVNISIANEDITLEDKKAPALKQTGKQVTLPSSDEILLSIKSKISFLFKSEKLIKFFDIKLV